MNKYGNVHVIFDTCLKQSHIQKMQVGFNLFTRYNTVTVFITTPRISVYGTKRLAWSGFKDLLCPYITVSRQTTNMIIYTVLRTQVPENNGPIWILYLTHEVTWSRTTSSNMSRTTSNALQVNYDIF